MIKVKKIIITGVCLSLAVLINAQQLPDSLSKVILGKLCQQLDCIPVEMYKDVPPRTYIRITEGSEIGIRVERSTWYPCVDSLILQNIQSTKKELSEFMTDTASYNNAKWLYYRGYADDGHKECVICISFEFTEYGIYKDLKRHGALVVRSLSPNISKLRLDSLQSKFNTTSKPYTYDLNNLYSEDGRLMVNDSLCISKEALKTLKYMQLGNYYLPLIYQQLCYPPEAREKEIEGLVVVKISREKIMEQVQVKKKKWQSVWGGRCTDLSVEVVQSPHELLSQAVLEAFRQIPNDEFCPFPECYIPIQFMLEKELPMEDLQYGQAIVIRKNEAKARRIVND